MPQAVTQIEYADAYQQATVSVLTGLVKPQNGVFSATCLAHCLTTDTQLMGSVSADGTNIAQAIGQWLQGTQVSDISSCQGYADCVSQCPGGNQIFGIQTAQQNSQQLSPTEQGRAAAYFSQSGSFSSEEQAASPPPGNAWDRTSVWVKSQVDLMGGGTHAKASQAAGSSGGAGQGFVSDPTGGGLPPQQAQGPIAAANSWILQGRRRGLRESAVAGGGRRR